MKCFFELDDFVRAWKAIQVIDTDNYLDNTDHPDWHGAILRVEADNGRLTLKGPFGEGSCPATIETRGVLFLPIWHFVEVMSGFYGDTSLHLTANDEHIQTNYQQFLCQPYEFELFPDPATAPTSWKYPGRPEPDDWFAEAEAE